MSTVQAEPQTDTHQLLTHQVTGLHRYLRSKVSCEEDARDIAQEACLKMLQASSKAKDIRYPKAYLYRIAHHLLYHHYASPNESSEAAVTDVDQLHSDDDGTEELTIDILRREQINKSMRELSAKCQTALVLRWREGLRVAEIAEHMNLSQAMVRKYLATGLAHFRKRLRRFVVADRSAA